MLDKSIKHYGVVMRKDSLKQYPKYKLSSGFRFVKYKSGDEEAWAAIEMAVSDFESHEAALAYFDKEFAPKQDMLEKRMLFIENAQGEKVATATAWEGKLDGITYPKLHWIAVKPEYQGRGLCKALLSKTLHLMDKLGHEGEVILFSQTWSYKAINLYYQYGFRPYDDGKSGKHTGNTGTFECDFHEAWRLIDGKIMEYRYGRG